MLSSAPSMPDPPGQAQDWANIYRDCASKLDGKDINFLFCALEKRQAWQRIGLTWHTHPRLQFSEGYSALLPEMPPILKHSMLALKWLVKKASRLQRWADALLPLLKQAAEDFDRAKKGFSDLAGGMPNKVEKDKDLRWGLHSDCLQNSYFGQPC